MRYLNGNNLFYEGFSKNLNNNVSSINSAYSLEGILFLDGNKLSKIKEYIELANDLKYNIIKIKCINKKITLLSI